MCLDEFVVAAGDEVRAVGGGGHPVNRARAGREQLADGRAVRRVPVGYFPVCSTGDQLALVRLVPADALEERVREHYLRAGEASAHHTPLIYASLLAHHYYFVYAKHYL